MSDDPYGNQGPGVRIPLPEPFDGDCERCGNLLDDCQCFDDEAE